jgi:hypothetical protein
MAIAIIPNANGTVNMQVAGVNSVSIAANGGVSGITFSDASVQTTAPQQSNGIIQVVQGVTTTSTTTTSLTDVTTNITATITPSSATSKILVQVNIGWILSTQSSASGAATFALYRGGSSIVSPWFRGPQLPGSNQSIYGNASGSYLDSPASATAVTYTLFFKTDATSIPQTVQASGIPSYITLYEIKQ